MFKLSRFFPSAPYLPLLPVLLTYWYGKLRDNANLVKAGSSRYIGANASSRSEAEPPDSSLLDEIEAPMESIRKEMEARGETGRFEKMVKGEPWVDEGGKGGNGAGDDVNGSGLNSTYGAGSYISSLKEMHTVQVESFRTHNFLKKGFDIGTGGGKKWMQRVVTEFMDFKTSLPLEVAGAIFVTWSEVSF